MKGNLLSFRLLLSIGLISLALIFTGCPPNGGPTPPAINGAYFMTKAAEQDKAETEDERDDCLYRNANIPTLCDSLVDRVNDLDAILADLNAIAGNIPSAGVDPDPDVPDPCIPANCIVEISVLRSMYFDISLAALAVELFDANGQTIGSSNVNDQPPTQALIDGGAFVHVTLNISNPNYQGNGLLRITSQQEVFNLPVNLIP
jgi:hypothetical protein